MAVVRATFRGTLMADFKVTFMFNGPLNTGWSETLYKPAVDYSTALTAANTLADFRGALLGNDCKIFDIRVSDDAEIGDSLTTGQVGFTPVVKTEEADVSWTAVQVRLMADARYRRTLMLRGIPDYVYTPDALSAENQGQWQKAWDRWKTKLIQLNFAMKAKKRDVTVPALTIKSFTPIADPKGYTVRTYLPHGLAPGNELFIYNLKAAPQAKGLKIAGNTPGVTEVEILADPNPTFVYNGKAYLRKVVYFYPLITEAVRVRISKRNTGRPFGLYLGRSR